MGVRAWDDRSGQERRTERGESRAPSAEPVTREWATSFWSMSRAGATTLRGERERRGKRGDRRRMQKGVGRSPGSKECRGGAPSGTRRTTRQASSEARRGPERGESAPRHSCLMGLADDVEHSLDLGVAQDLREWVWCHWIRPGAARGPAQGSGALGRPCQR